MFELNNMLICSFVNAEKLPKQRKLQFGGLFPCDVASGYCELIDCDCLSGQCSVDLSCADELHL
uniref:Uncharacterized protein n=1 Tax=Arundo donax TaxID=35708 RepID=A0A0A8YUT8_ARUDO